VVEVDSSHLVMLTHPEVVVDLKTGAIAELGELAAVA
jgi:hypothetical protein